MVILLLVNSSTLRRSCEKWKWASARASKCQTHKNLNMLNAIIGLVGLFWDGDRLRFKQTNKQTHKKQRPKTKENKSRKKKQTKQNKTKQNKKTKTKTKKKKQNKTITTTKPKKIKKRKKEKTKTKTKQKTKQNKNTRNKNKKSLSNPWWFCGKNAKLEREIFVWLKINYVENMVCACRT